MPFDSPTWGLPWDDQEVPDQRTLDDMLRKTKGKLFIHGHGAGFLGSLLCDHALIWDEGCKTAWCNGETIGWNPKFFCWLTPLERLFILAHELWHTAYMHMEMLKGRNPKRVNYATDYVINHRLEDDGYECSRLKHHLLFDRQWDGMSSYEIYEQLPDHLAGPDILGDDLFELPDGMKPDSVMEKLVKARQASRASREHGVIPGEVEEMIENWLNPILPWDRLLYRWFTEIDDNMDWSMARPSRRHTEDYLPSLVRDDGGLTHLAYYIDVSGSTYNEPTLKRFLSEAAYVHNQFQPEKMTLVTFDTRITDEFVILKDDVFDRVNLLGGGGTCFEPVLEHIEEHKPTAAIVFSDMCCPPMSRDPGIPIVWIAIGSQDATVPFGKLIHIRQE